MFGANSIGIKRFDILFIFLFLGIIVYLLIKLFKFVFSFFDEETKAQKKAQKYEEEIKKQKVLKQVENIKNTIVNIPKIHSVTQVIEYERCNIKSLLLQKNGVTQKNLFSQIFSISENKTPKMIQGSLGHCILYYHHTKKTNFEDLYDYAVNDIKKENLELNDNSKNSFYGIYVKKHLKNCYENFKKSKWSKLKPLHLEKELFFDRVIGHVDMITTNNILIDYKFSDRSQKEIRNSYGIQIGGYYFLALKNGISIKSAKIIILKENEIRSINFPKNELEHKADEFENTVSEFVSYYDENITQILNGKIYSSNTYRCRYCQFKNLCDYLKIN